ncbi:DUF2009 protein [Schizosaccharomyces octosporus yFS286]|uniref:DUF2009 protein n=1 Tax=Schizosaccharomyces octosporus (strain yFS286) TaxID=483514 RepID=S9PT78_SCHOY|nr:DUF2009 protein [Schizosaccharomyces octosporus yFS286]EPX70698.1 DUF2009 protein [Schizosaccharomyces octosporus yFS286]
MNTEELRELYLSSILPESLPDNHKSTENAPCFMSQRSKVIPVRLEYQERKLLHLLVAALDVCDYTDTVDTLRFSSKAKRTAQQLKGITSVLAGIMIAYDYKAGQELLESKDFEKYAGFFQDVFEIGRRYKVLNPNRLGSTYGKLMYFVQDSMCPEVQENLGFNLFKPILTVYEYLKDRKALKVLEDPYITNATIEIVAGGRSRSAIQKDIKTKERSVETIAKRHASSSITKDQIRWCLYSLADSNSYLRFNRDPVAKLIDMVKQNFSPDTVDDEFSLAIDAANGSRLQHNHYKQYHYVLQSLNLWLLIMGEIFSLWALSDLELTNPDVQYELVDNNQGVHRIQACPNIRIAMERILSRAQRQAGSWIGDSTIHLGDTAVPNALLFIDKYMQVPRILTPLVLFFEELDSLHDQALLRYIETAFGGKEYLKKMVLTDFMRFGFDGSGADNWFDAGSCIDGRLTSAWNWANSIHTKDYYRVLLMTGFLSFNGE